MNSRRDKCSNHETDAFSNVENFSHSQNGIQCMYLHLGTMINKVLGENTEGEKVNGEEFFINNCNKA